MANQWYPKAFNHIGAGSDLTANTIKWLAVTSGYTFSTSHEFVTDVGGGNIVGRTGALTSKTLGTIAAGVFSAANTVFSALTGSTVTQLIMYIDSGSDATSVLLLQINSTNCAGLPFTPTGADAPLVFPSGGIATL